MEYAFKYDDVIKNTKREVAKRRKEARNQKLSASLEQLSGWAEQEVNLLDHYDVYYSMFSLTDSSSADNVISITYNPDYLNLKTLHGFHNAYMKTMDLLCVQHC